MFFFIFTKSKTTRVVKGDGFIHAAGAAFAQGSVVFNTVFKNKKKLSCVNKT